jgi:hypothetical protein
VRLAMTAVVAKAELGRIVSRMRQEHIVEFAEASE